MFVHFFISQRLCHSGLSPLLSESPSFEGLIYSLIRTLLCVSVLSVYFWLLLFLFLTIIIHSFNVQCCVPLFFSLLRSSLFAVSLLYVLGYRGAMIAARSSSSS